MPKESKINALRKSKGPGWERLVDKLIDDEIPGPCDEGGVFLASTDVADVNWIALIVEFSVATNALGTHGHSGLVAQSKAGIAHKALIYAAKIVAATALDLLTKQELINKAKEERKKRLRGRTYKICGVVYR